MFRNPTGVSSFLVPSFNFFTVSWSMKFSVAPLSMSIISSAMPLNDDKETGISSLLSLLNMYTVRRCRPLAKAANWDPKQNPKL
jgi:hypothetical protein